MGSDSGPGDRGHGDRGQANRTERICAALRSAILERALLPGAKLPEDALGERFGSSRTIVRQALERLAVEGLVELRRNRGAVVATPSLEEARDLFELRARIEAMVVERLARDFTPAQAAVLTAHVAKEVAAEGGPEPVSIRLATEFHILLAELTESPVLIRYVGEMGYRCGLTLALNSRPHSADCAIQEHREIIEALSAHDAPRAQALMEHHLSAVADRAALTRGEAARLGYLDVLEPYARPVRDAG